MIAFGEAVIFYVIYYRAELEDNIMEALLSKLYHDPKTGFVGAQALYEKANELNHRITLKFVKQWYSKQIDIQRYKEQKRQFDDFKIASTNPNSWQADLTFWDNKIVLTAININSRIGYASLLPNKQATTVLTAIKTFVKTHKVDIITTDNGSEFINKQVQAYFKSIGITHYNNEVGDHSTMGKIERFNRTLKSRLIKIGNALTAKLLSDVIMNYNSTKHRSINMTPNEARGQVIESELEYNNENISKLENELEIGSSVLYRLKKKQFGKEDVRWSKTVYSIVGIDGYRVQIRSKNNHTLYKSANDLKNVKTKSTNAKIKPNQIYEAKKILNHEQQKSGKFKYLVKWIGYDEPTWEPQDNLRLINKNVKSTLEKEYWATK